MSRLRAHWETRASSVVTRETKECGLCPFCLAPLQSSPRAPTTPEEKLLRLPLLVFGGPYSNLNAVRALRARAGALGIRPDQCICTGDVIAYCAEPEETAIAIREWECKVVSGN